MINDNTWWIWWSADIINNNYYIFLMVILRNTNNLKFWNSENFEIFEIFQNFQKILKFFKIFKIFKIFKFLNFLKFLKIWTSKLTLWIAKNTSAHSTPGSFNSIYSSATLIWCVLSVFFNQSIPHILKFNTTRCFLMRSFHSIRRILLQNSKCNTTWGNLMRSFRFF